MKTRFTQWSMVVALLIGTLLNAQTDPQTGRLGINNSSPRATLDVQPSTENLTESATTNEGIILPKISKTRLAQIAENRLVEGTIVYINDVSYTGANTKVTPVTEKGYYVYDGTQWKKFKGSAPTGLEKITQNDNTGWRLIGQDPNNYGDIGYYAVDLSQQNSNAVNTGATGAYSTALGGETKASGEASTAMGAFTTASGGGSTAMGIGTIASGEASTSIGKYNYDDINNIFAVGNGSDKSHRKNALVIDQGGNVAIGKDEADRTEGAAKLQVAGGDISLKYGKIGINVDKPRATVDFQVTAEDARWSRKNPNTPPTTTNIGMIPPKVDSYRLLSIDDANLVAGTIVYVENCVFCDKTFFNLGDENPKCAEVDGDGLYIYNGEKWKPLKSSYVGDNGITVNENTVSLDNNTTAKLDKIDDLYKHRLVRWDEINKRSGRTKITGTQGYWLKESYGWAYHGAVMVIVDNKRNGFIFNVDKFNGYLDRYRNGQNFRYEPHYWKSINDIPTHGAPATYNDTHGLCLIGAYQRKYSNITETYFDPTSTHVQGDVNAGTCPISNTPASQDTGWIVPWELANQLWYYDE